LLSTVLDNLAKRNNLDKGVVEDVICGCVTPGKTFLTLNSEVKQQGSNIPRLALLKAGYPIEVPGGFFYLTLKLSSTQQVKLGKSY
jgi:acetyl-CoA acyltransferase